LRTAVGEVSSELTAEARAQLEPLVEEFYAHLIEEDTALARDLDERDAERTHLLAELDAVEAAALAAIRDLKGAPAENLA
jgi:hypothetical protein